MADRKIAWKTEKDGQKFEGEMVIPFPENLEAAVEKYGEETVFLGFAKSHDIYIQARARREATKDEKPMSASEIAAEAPTWAVKFSERETIDPVEKALAQFEKLSPEKKQALLASLQDMLA